MKFDASWWVTSILLGLLVSTNLINIIGVLLDPTWENILVMIIYFIALALMIAFTKAKYNLEVLEDE